MAFTGTLDKCSACDKTVYFVDLLSADGVTYHKSCFKCSHCKGTLVTRGVALMVSNLHFQPRGCEFESPQEHGGEFLEGRMPRVYWKQPLYLMVEMSNYSSMEGVLYCKHHFEQLFKESGNFTKNFQNSKAERQNSLTRAPSKLSAMFSGTQDKCAACDKTVYPLEKVTMEGESFHKSCFKCAHGGCPLTHATYASLDGNLYCKHHFAQLFMEKGNYQHVLKAANNKKSSAAVTPVNETEENAAEEENNKEPENAEEPQQQS